MFVVQTTHSKTGLKRPDRPCDSCRRRKSRCVFSENDSVCFLCRFHNYECVFSENPAPRKRQRRNSADLAPKDAAVASAAAKEKDAKDGKDKDMKDKDAKDAKDKDAPASAMVEVAPAVTSESASGTLTATSSPPVPKLQSMSGVLALNIQQDKKDNGEATTAKRTRATRTTSRKASASAMASSDTNSTPPASTAVASAATPDSPFPDYDFLPHTLLKNTLGLQCRRYISYIGTSAEHDPVLMDHYGFDSRDRASLPAVGPDFQTKRQIRRVQTEDSSGISRNGQVSFVVFESEDLFRTGYPNPSGRDDTIGGNLVEVRKIQDIIGKFGRQLVGLYFRIVHPSLPILHKEEFLEKYYRNPSELSPSLLAGLYVFAINWWTYDADLVPFPRPPQSSLEALAQINLYREIDRPTLSTVQAGILLLQHQTFRNQVTRPSHSWAMLSEVVAVAQEVGLHMDPTKWAIPEWERGVRKRLAWGLYIQDKWMALTFGRPSHIHKINWTVTNLEDDNFPDDDGLLLASGGNAHGGNGDDEDGLGGDDLIIADNNDNNGSVNRETGKVMFMQLVNLTKILSDIMDEFHSAQSMADLFAEDTTSTAPTSGGDVKSDQHDPNSDVFRIKRLLAKARPLQIRLKDWLEQLPDCLRMENITFGELSASGNLHLGYHAAQIALFRPILSALSKVDRNQSPALNEIYGLVYRSAFAEFVSAVEFANNLKPQHIQTFWYAASKNNFAIIATFGVILLLTASTDAERTACSEKLAEFQWTLKVNVRGAEFLQHAILWVEECKYLLKSELSKKGGSKQQSSQVSSQQTQPTQQLPTMNSQAQLQQLPISMQQVIPPVPPAPHMQHPLQHLQQLQQHLHLQRQQQQQQLHISRGHEMSSFFGTSDHQQFADKPMILPTSQAPVLHPPHLSAPILQPLQPQGVSMPPYVAHTNTTMGENDIFFTSLATDGRSHVIDQHASTSVDELDNLEFFNMRMLSHPWLESSNAPLGEMAGAAHGTPTDDGGTPTGMNNEATVNDVRAKANGSVTGSTESGSGKNSGNAGGADDDGQRDDDWM
ncbi:fungal-specific transcription factor domain-containing protein [Lipomyces tetrasporus]|uniref:Fungal-specific transcription factor domain-containing protein n=1 Tax=Lipomyces tetrasporus TaxID=54092 RepID=A0AAD7QT47_9ASCO|nr:fungal-specific transcription factor domain-containing protein [Lipomyces tetrasporus]KAJ8100970.1 fungal-specific transcription factor domain-containing protein [Lipomyces tetrasporus]